METTKQKRLIPVTVGFGLFYFFLYSGINPIATYMNIYLEKDLGFTGSQIGLYNGIAMGVCIIAIPLVGMLGDKTRAYKPILLTLLTGALVFSTLLGKQTKFLPIILFGIALEVSRNNIVPAADTQVMSYSNKHGLNYGLMKSMGSLGAITCGSIVGILAARFGVGKTLFPAYFIVTALALFMAITFPKQEPLKIVTKEETKGKGSFGELIHNHGFLTILLLSFTSNVVGDTVTAYAGNHMVMTLGVSEIYMSIGNVLMVLPEVFLLTQLKKKLLPKMGFHRIYIMAAIGAMIRFAIYFLAPTANIFLVGYLFHCCYSIVNMAVHVTVLRKMVAPGVFGTAVASLNMVFMIGKALYGYIYGVIYQYLGSRSIFAMAFCLAGISLCIALRTHVFDSLKSQE